MLCLKYVWHAPKRQKGCVYLVGQWSGSVVALEQGCQYQERRMKKPKNSRHFFLATFIFVVLTNLEEACFQNTQKHQLLLIPEKNFHNMESRLCSRATSFQPGEAGRGGRGGGGGGGEKGLFFPISEMQLPHQTHFYQKRFFFGCLSPEFMTSFYSPPSSSSSSSSHSPLSTTYITQPPPPQNPQNKQKNERKPTHFPFLWCINRHFPNLLTSTNIFFSGVSPETFLSLSLSLCPCFLSSGVEVVVVVE